MLAWEARFSWKVRAFARKVCLGLAYRFLGQCIPAEKKQSLFVLFVALPPSKLNVTWRAATFNRLLLQLAFKLAYEFCSMQHGTKTIAKFKSRALVQQQ